MIDLIKILDSAEANVEEMFRDADEIGSSDVSICVNRVIEECLKGEPEEIIEAYRPNIRQSVQFLIRTMND